MAKQGVKLTREGARKLARIVRNQRSRSLYGDRPQRGLELQETVWGRLIEEGEDDAAGCWAWEEVKHGEEDWEVVEDGRTGTTTSNFAFEANGASADPGDVVLLRRTPRPKAAPTNPNDLDERDFQTCWSFVIGGGGSSAERFQVTSAGPDYSTPEAAGVHKTFAARRYPIGGALTGDPVAIIAAMYQDSGDFIFAQQLNTGHWVQIPRLPGSTSDKHVLQIDGVGRLKIDRVRII